MRYAIFTDIHANLEALEAVLASIDKIATEKPIDQIWFLGDLVGYGPNPNECISKLCERTDIIIAGNHDWAAVGKLDLDEFSAAARVSAEWTAEQLTEEHREFLKNLPERLEIGKCTLVHGSPFGPLWEYLTSEVLAERSFQHFSSRFCLVGHTHVPVIFQQPDSISTIPTVPLANTQVIELSDQAVERSEGDNEDTAEMVAITPTTSAIAATQIAAHAESAYADPDTGQAVTEENANAILEAHIDTAEEQQSSPSQPSETETSVDEDTTAIAQLDNDEDTIEIEQDNGDENIVQVIEAHEGDTDTATEDANTIRDEEMEYTGEPKSEDIVTPETDITNAEDRLNGEIAELLELLGLSESMIHVTNEMITPPEGRWECPEGYRAIINCGGVGQPRDGDPRAAFMIYDTEAGFEFYRVSYPFNKTQEKIIRAGLPQYLAIRLAYGR